MNNREAREDTIYERLVAPWHAERISGPMADGVDNRARIVPRGGCLDRLGEHSLTTGGNLGVARMPTSCAFLCW